MFWTEEVPDALNGVPRTEQRRVGVDAFEVFEWRPGQAVLGLAEARTHGEPRRKVRDHARAVMRDHLQLGMAFHAARVDQPREGGRRLIWPPQRPPQPGIRCGLGWVVDPRLVSGRE